MAEFRLGRLKFVWKGNWAASTAYVKDDIISFGGKSYVCTLSHTSSSNFYTDEETKWDLMADGFQWKGAWTGSTYYKVNDVVSSNGKTYVCNTGHTSASTHIDTNLSYWDVFADGTKWLGTWTGSTYYALNDIVRNGGKSYIALEGHTSNSDFYVDLLADKWALVNDGFQWKSQWTPSTYYKLNDIVRFGSGTYVCTVAHTSSTTFNEVKWDTFNAGIEFEDSWDSATEYQIGDVVAYGGYTFYALTRNTNKVPTEELGDWKPFVEGFNARGTWAMPGVGNPVYRVGDVVMYGGNSYVCIQDAPTQDPRNGTYWQLYAEGFKWQGTWTEGTLYKVGEVVKQGTSSYVCIQAHTGTALGDFPNDPASDTINTYWEILADGSASAVVTTQGDMIYRDSTGATRLPIGSTDQILAVVAGEPAWTNTANISGSSLNVTGGVTAGGNLKIDDAGDGGALYIGSGASQEIAGGTGSTNLTDASVVIMENTDAFAQVALKNLNNGLFASTDLIVYADNGDNDSGWMDMGITSSNFDITSGYGITGKNDGYIFMSAPVGTTGGGNLVIATGENGSQRDIVFVTGGFDPNTNPDAEKVRIIGEGRNGAYFTGSISDNTLTVTAKASGVIVYDGTKTINGLNIEPGTVITSQLSGTPGGVGTYHVDIKQTVSSTSIIQDQDPAGVEVYIDTESTNQFTGALRVQGGIGLQGNLNAFGEITAYGGAIYQGRDGGVTAKQLTQDNSVFAGYVGLTNASGVFTGDADDFVQFALKNHNAGTSASTDVIAYSSAGDNDSGWIDMGITSESYSDPEFTVTGPNTGYIFMAAPDQSGGLVATVSGGTLSAVATTINVDSTTGFPTSGTLVIAGGEQVTYSGKTATSFTGVTRGVNSSTAASHITGTRIYKLSTASYTGDLLIGTGTGGSHNDIVLFSGGFDAGNERIRIIGNTRSGHAEGVEILAPTESTSSSTGALRVSGGIGLQGNMNVGGNIVINGTITVAGGGSSVSTTTLTVSDPMIVMGSGNASDIIDLGFYGVYTSSGTKYAGLVRDASDGNFKLFTQMSTAPTSTVNFTGATYAALQIGALTATSGSFSSTLAVTSDFAVNTNKFTVTASSGNTSVAGTLGVASDLAVNTNKFTVTASSGNTSIAGTLGVTSDFAVNTNKFTVTASSGNTSVAGTLGVTGQINGSSASFSGALSALSLTESSSITLKENINPIDNALDAIMQLVGVTYDRKDGSTKNEAGLIAEDVNRIIPNIVSKDANGNAEGIQYTKLTAYLIEAVKSLKAEIDHLKGIK